jgi:small subunit ribosomal protein S6
MAESSNRLYEGLFLMDQQATAGDLNAALNTVQQILDRAEAEVLALRKWDERRLAYEINGQRRGLYLLALFRVPGQRIANMERDVNLSDEVLRVMFTRADHMGETEINQAIEAAKGTRDEAAVRSAGEGPTETPEEQAEDESEPGPEEEPVAAGRDEAERE